MKTHVVVVGGGPGGSVCASELARRGLRVVVLEKTKFPRFHLGESLLPQSLVVLEKIGVLEAVRDRFLVKYGARFHDDIRQTKDRFAFEDAWKPSATTTTTDADEKKQPSFDHAFQVPRDAFDALLLDHARACGADVRESLLVTRVTFDEAGRANGVDVDVDGDGATHIAARFVVDASGRDVLLGRGSNNPAAGNITKIDGLDQTAIYAHFNGIPRHAGLLEGDIDVVLFDSGEPRRPNWFWFIPFKDGRTSVGAVVSRAWVRARKSDEGTDALFEQAVRSSPTATSFLANATCLWPKKEATADFSYRVGAMTGPGWLAIGDAGGFIDPLFSTGAHLAMSGAMLAADVIVSALENNAVETELRATFEKRMRAAAETFILAVQAFYAGPLVEYLFIADKHLALRRSITSLLAGDVFGDAIWLRDTRLRLKAMIETETKP